MNEGAVGMALFLRKMCTLCSLPSLWGTSTILHWFGVFPISHMDVQVLRTTSSLKVVRLVEDCLRHISLGLLANSALATPDLLMMVHRVCSDNNSGLGMLAGKNKWVVLDLELLEEVSSPFYFSSVDSILFWANQPFRMVSLVCVCIH